jgi:hypothetical protein
LFRAQEAVQEESCDEDQEGDRDEGGGWRRDSHFQGEALEWSNTECRWRGRVGEMFEGKWGCGEEEAKRLFREGSVVGDE